MRKESEKDKKEGEWRGKDKRAEKGRRKGELKEEAVKPSQEWNCKS